MDCCGTARLYGRVGDRDELRLRRGVAHSAQAQFNRSIGERPLLRRSYAPPPLAGHEDVRMAAARRGHWVPAPVGAVRLLVRHP